MKWTACLSVSMLAFVVAHGSVRAAAPEDADPNNPYSRLDPDGVPLAVTQSPSHTVTAEQVEAMRQQAIEAERNRNWLMIEYEQQLRLRSKDPAQKDKAPNLYLQLSMDKNLARLAGLDPIENTDEPTPAPALHANPSPSAKNTASLRAEAPASKNAFTPLISPLSSSNASFVQAFSIPTYSSAIPSILTPFPNSNGMPPANPTPAPATPAHSSAYTEVSDLQTPGMVASKDNPLGDTGTPDLSLDSLPGEALPGETDEQARAREQGASQMQLPQAMDADQLHQEQAAKLALPVAANQTKTAPTDPKQPVPPKAIPVNPEDAPVPVTQQQQLTPVHAPIANPFDILNR